MRTALTVVLGMSLAGCLGVVDAPGGSTPPPGGGGDDDTGGTPALNVAIDKGTISTELGSSNVATVTLTSSGGFTGSATITASVVDAAGTAISDWTVTLDNPTVTVPANGVATAKATVMIPTLMGANLTGTLKLDVTAGELSTQSVSSAITAANVVTLVITENAAGQCVYPAVQATQVKSGTEVHWLNMSNDITNMIIHSDGAANIAHENQAAGAGTPINQFYAQTPSATTQTSDHWYCHSLNDPGNGQVIVVNP